VIWTTLKITSIVEDRWKNVSVEIVDHRGKCAVDDSTVGIIASVQNPQGFHPPAAAAGCIMQEEFTTEDTLG
jgi:hypothetical protein